MRHVGFSTGAVARGDFALALALLACEPVDSIELSALRYQEVEPLIAALPKLNLQRYGYISFHAPSNFTPEQEPPLANLLYHSVPQEWPIVLHPDTIHDWNIWRPFGSRLAIENMDRRKSKGRTVEELGAVYSELPHASFCLDIGHARQYDTSMTEAYRLVQKFKSRLCQIHISEVNSASQHDRISYTAALSFRQVASFIPDDVPLIIESRVDQSQIQSEIESALSALPSVPEQTALAS